MTHICVVKMTIIGSDNGLSPGRRQAIIWTNVGILFIRPLGTNFSEMLIAIETFSFKKMHLKIWCAKWRSFCLGLNVLIRIAQCRMKISWLNHINTLQATISGQQNYWHHRHVYFMSHTLWRWGLSYGSLQSLTRHVTYKLLFSDERCFLIHVAVVCRLVETTDHMLTSDRI